MEKLLNVPFTEESHMGTVQIDADKLLTWQMILQWQ